MTSTLKFNVDADGIATLTLEVPGKPVNVITPEFQDDLAAAIERIATDESIRGAVITSARRDFMAGDDLKEPPVVSEPV